jgi:hypothetical protein
MVFLYWKKTIIITQKIGERLTGKTSLKSQAYPLSIEHLLKHKTSLGSFAIWVALINWLNYTFCLFILGFNLIFVFKKFQFGSLCLFYISIWSFSSVLSYIADGLHIWTDMWTLGHVSNWNCVIDKIDRKNQLIQIETY